ncbi:MAG: Mpv17/PMP22 family protein [Bacteroidia bacterium]|nr:Mpv17/PMP22 family protein [Bacteroidia bacterium]
MKKQDVYFLGFVIMFFALIFQYHALFGGYEKFNHDHGMLMSFIKFAILATLGEVIGLRIKTGSYYKKGFGIIPRAIVWGFLGLAINGAFIIFSTGTPSLLASLGIDNADQLLKGPFCAAKILAAFSVSAALNLVFAPVMMTIHKITDTHIISTGGTVSGFFSPIRFGENMMKLNWYVQWNYVFKKTIPFFWIPAHTITFLLPPDYRILFAALLGIILGVILSVANLTKTTAVL